MSFNRLNYDTCQYQQHISESSAPGHYQLNTPPIACDPCYPVDVQTRLQSSGGSVDTSRPLIDIDSEMLNITRPSSKCPSRKWVPQCENYTADGYPCGQGVVGTCNKCTTAEDGKQATEPNQPREAKCPDQFSQRLTHWRDCGKPVEDTRLVNPAGNLRGTGFNRWEWLCLNPQDRVEMPFDYNISNRLVVKDNHRPCVPTPISVEPSIPKSNNDAVTCDTTTPTCSVPTNAPSVHWQSCSNLSAY
jgi:hypothetical protein